MLPGIDIGTSTSLMNGLQSYYYAMWNLILYKMNILNLLRQVFSIYSRFQTRVVFFKCILLLMGQYNAQRTHLLCTSHDH